MKLRSSVAAIGAVLALMTGITAPASATHVVGRQECLSRNDFFEFFREHSSTDKHCYAGENPQHRNRVYLGLTNVTWFHSGNNRAWVEYSDRHGRRLDRYFDPGFDDGCDYCTVYAITIEDR